MLLAQTPEFLGQGQREETLTVSYTLQKLSTKVVK